MAIPFGVTRFLDGYLARDFIYEEKTHEELADMIGSSRETVTRALTRFKKDKLIEIHGVSVLILSPEKLEMLTA